MLLAVDIGNSAIKFGLFDGETLSSKFSIPTIRDSKAEDLSSAVADRLSTNIDSVVVCSVVPEIDGSISKFIRESTGLDPRFIRNTDNFGLKIKYSPLESLGTDRLVNAFAAVEKYGAPVIVCSLGTATTIDAVSSDREFLGGVIAPGLDAMAEALHLKAPKLPRVEVSQTESLIGNSTSDAIRSGIFNGYVAMVSGLIERFKQEVGDAKVIATGGNASRLSAELGSVWIGDSSLLLDGLRIIGRRWPTV